MGASWSFRCCVAPLLSVFVNVSCTTSAPVASSKDNLQVAQGSHEQILLGRQLVLTHDCGGCHGGSTTVGLEFHNPVAAGRCYACHATTSRNSAFAIPMTTTRPRGFRTAK